MAQSIRDYLESIRIRQTARAALQQIDKALVGVLENSVFSPETVTAMDENKEFSANY